MNEKRRRERCEYLREYKMKKKEKAMMIKRERLERYYMGKEDVKVVAATLAPPSPYSTLPSVPSFVRDILSSQRTYRQCVVCYNDNLHFHVFSDHCTIHLCLGVFAIGLSSSR